LVSGFAGFVLVFVSAGLVSVLLSDFVSVLDAELLEVDDELVSLFADLL
jgi:hypothetical protein